MPDLFDFIGALIGEFKGPVGFVDEDAQTYTRDQDWVEEHAESLLILPETEDGELLFLWAYLEDFDRAEIDDMRLAPTAVLANGADAVVFWALEEPVKLTQRVRKTCAHIEPDMLEGVPVAGSRGWEVLHFDPDVFHPYKTLAKAYGPKPKQAKIGEAVLHGKLDLDDERLKREIKVSAGSGRDAKTWKTQTITIADLIAVMSAHTPGKKDGPAMVLGELAGGRRVKSAVKAVYGIGLDVDVGMPGEEIDALLEKFGHLAVRHTTHSHMKSMTSIKEVDLTRWLKKSEDHDEIDDESVRAYLEDKAKLLPEIVETAEIVATEHREQGVVVDVAHAPIEKHRIIFPFKTPFVVADQGGQEEALALFKKMPARLAHRIGGIPIDTAATDPSRLFYLPRHDEGAPYESAIFGGPMLDWENLVKLSPIEEVAEAVTVDEKGKGKTKTEAGKKLISWAKRDAAGFQIADVIRAYAEDKIRIDSGDKLTVECPFDEYHSNAGDPEDVGFFVTNAGEGPVDSFVAHCQHDSCQDHSILDFLGRMIEQDWFSDEVLADEEFNILDHEDDSEAGPDDPEDDERKKRKGSSVLDQIIDDIHAELEKKTWDNQKLTELLEEFVAENPGSAAEESLRDKFSLYKNGHSKFTRLVRKAKNTSVSDHTGEYDKQNRLIYQFQNEPDFDKMLGIATRALKDQNQDIPNICAVTDRPAKLVSLPDGSTQYEEITSEGIWAMINESTVFVKGKADGEGTTVVAADTAVAKQIYQTAYKIFPQAPEIIYTPVFGSQGDLISEPGWYRDEETYLAPTDFEVPEVYDEPEWDEVEEAVTWLTDELLVDFPFLDTDIEGNERREPSLANALSMLVTPFMRRMIDGTTPLFLVNKPVPGTGGTFLGSLPVKLCEGDDPTPLHYSQNDEEMQKALLASIMEAKSHLFFDNVSSFNSRVILAALTSRTIGGRILGQSKTVSRPNTFGWIATGNNPMLSEEMERRTVRINLNAKTTDIQLRKFKHGPSFPLENRAKAVHCILTMIQWWVAQGQPRFMQRKRASYEDWSEKVGGVLQACGIEGFLDNRKLVVGDMTEAALREFIMLWLERWGVEEPATAMDLFQHALDNDLQYLQGNNEDQKRSRFQVKLPALNGRLFEIGDRKIMVRETINADKVPVYLLSDETETDEAA